jgi:hypothetical protein
VPSRGGCGDRETSWPVRRAVSECHVEKWRLVRAPAAGSGTAGWEPKPSPHLPSRHTILDVVGCLLANRCQVEQLLLYRWVFGPFGKLPILGRFVPQIISPIHVAPKLQHLPEVAGGRSTIQDEPFDLRRKPRPPDYGRRSEISSPSQPLDLSKDSS